MIYNYVKRLEYVEMNAKDFTYMVETKKSLNEAVVSVLRETEKKGWSVLQIHNLSDRLNARGFKQKPMKVIEICSGKHANNFLNKDKLISLFMPCKINVFEDSGKIKIVSMKPLLISQFFSKVGKEEAEKVENDIKEIINNAK